MYRELINDKDKQNNFFSLIENNVKRNGVITVNRNSSDGKHFRRQYVTMKIDVTKASINEALSKIGLPTIVTKDDITVYNNTLLHMKKPFWIGSARNYTIIKLHMIRNFDDFEGFDGF